MRVFDGDKLKRLRQKRRLTQRELAQVIGRQATHVSNYENGVATPPSDVLLTLIAFFKVDAHALSREDHARLAA